MLLIQQASADSWRPMVRALEAWDDGRPIYETVFFEQHVKFQYPPSSLLLPLAVRSEQRTGDPLFFALNDIGLAATLLLVGCVLFLFLRTWQTDRSQSALVRLWAGAAIVGLGALMYFPVTIWYVLGQIQTHRQCRRWPSRSSAGCSDGAWPRVSPSASRAWSSRTSRCSASGALPGAGWSFVAAVMATAAVGVLASVVAVRVGGTGRLHASARLHRRTRRSPLRQPDGQRPVESAGAAARASRVGLSQLPAAASGRPRRLHRDERAAAGGRDLAAPAAAASPARRSISPSRASASRWRRRLPGITTTACCCRYWYWRAGRAGGATRRSRGGCRRRWWSRSSPPPISGSRSSTSAILRANIVQSYVLAGATARARGALSRRPGDCRHRRWCGRLKT